MNADHPPLARLRSGSHGIGAEFPSDWTVESAFDNDGFILSDPAHDVVWIVAHVALPLDIAADVRQQLELDVRDAAAAAYANDRRERQANAREATNPDLPIVRDSAWTPLISVRILEVPGGPALDIVHRLTHCVGLETVAGRLLIPTARGYSEIACQAVDRTSGIRAALVSTLSRDRVGRFDPSGAVDFARFCDEQRHDALVPDALTRVRRAVLWLTSPEGAGLKVLEPPSPPLRGRVMLDNVRSSIVPPPRFLHVQGLPGLATNVA
ncbi:MAG: hypothetical protein JSR54_08445, partial [Proteobacteria bacterium]|nr:hypothetical protein [Pseudomonadota bacterium]